jgi:hypothetical protein
MKRCFAHIAHSINVGTGFDQKIDGIPISPPHHDMERCIVHAIRTVDGDLCFT